MYYISWVICHVSLKFFVLAQWDELIDLGSVSTRHRTSQVMNNKEASCLSLTAVFVTFIMHPVYFQKTSAAPFGNSSPQLRGAWVCTWADLQILQGGAAPPLQTETRWTKGEEFLCLSDPLVKAPHFCRLLCWMGVARYSRKYTGCMSTIYFLCVHLIKRRSCGKCW